MSDNLTETFHPINILPLYDLSQQGSGKKITEKPTKTKNRFSCFFHSYIFMLESWLIGRKKICSDEKFPSISCLSNTATEHFVCVCDSAASNDSNFSFCRFFCSSQSPLKNLMILLPVIFMLLYCCCLWHWKFIDDSGLSMVEN